MVVVVVKVGNACVQCQVAGKWECHRVYICIRVPGGGGAGLCWDGKHNRLLLAVSEPARFQTRHLKMGTLAQIRQDLIIRFKSTEMRLYLSTPVREVQHRVKGGA